MIWIWSWKIVSCPVSLGADNHSVVAERKIAHNNVTPCGWWDCKKPDEKLETTLSVRGLKWLPTSLWLRERREGDWNEGSKYGSFEFRPGRRIGFTSEKQHMKRGNLGDFSICHGGGPYKWSYHPCAPPSNLLPIAFQDSSLPPSLCLSFIPAPRAMFLGWLSRKQFICHTIP